MRLTNLDMDLLRTLSVASELGGLGRAAERLGRSPSAISLQMHKLEEQVGKTLFRKQGRGISLTDAGDLLLGYARRILALNDEALAATRGVGVEGIVRLGVPFDLTSEWLPKVLARFSEAYPRVHIELRTDRSVELLQLYNQDLLDLTLAFGPVERPGASFVAEVPVRWIGSTGFRLDKNQDVPLILLDPPCWFRQTGIDALDRHQTAWRLAFTSPSLAGLWAATEAGLGITVRTPLGMPRSLSALDPDHGLPDLPRVSIVLYNSARRYPHLTSFLETILVETLESALPSGSLQTVASRSMCIPPARGKTSLALSSN
ncbi:LysR substrate-binding domain-containing protein [Beijerinckia indica]|uniref:Transcriptional regulator, LysR family n=1 Tax=Beijerinckia indica subsp. indica (strain ATCC 9039 / DSM 1715 / NCIMB 8712) TaxID=395963 RepID=B2IEY6_BEII9|nr:LysR substrate-binding domain-containing protein [Beijerinckia indica]ACB94177.1 transcriptional regulator, LysR family [Beijerinckia indica subsp. indica ATCC 9039]